MAELHLWTAEKWQCPVCPKALILCSSPASRGFELTARVNDHLAEHRMLFQDVHQIGVMRPHLHMVLTPPEREWDMKDPFMWDVARAVIGQVIDA